MEAIIGASILAVCVILALALGRRSGGGMLSGGDATIPADQIAGRLPRELMGTRPADDFLPDRRRTAAARVELREGLSPKRSWPTYTPDYVCELVVSVDGASLMLECGILGEWRRAPEGFEAVASLDTMLDDSARAKHVRFLKVLCERLGVQEPPAPDEELGDESWNGLSLAHMGFIEEQGQRWELIKLSTYAPLDLWLRFDRERPDQAQLIVEDSHLMAASVIYGLSVALHGIELPWDVEASAEIKARGPILGALTKLHGAPKMEGDDPSLMRRVKLDTTGRAVVLQEQSSGCAVLGWDRPGGGTSRELLTLAKQPEDVALSHDGSVAVTYEELSGELRGEWIDVWSGRRDRWTYRIGAGEVQDAPLPCSEHRLLAVSIYDEQRDDSSQIIIFELSGREVARIEIDEEHMIDGVFWTPTHLVVSCADDQEDKHLYYFHTQERRTSVSALRAGVTLHHLSSRHRVTRQDHGFELSSGTIWRPSTHDEMWAFAYSFVEEHRIYQDWLFMEVGEPWGINLKTAQTHALVDEDSSIQSILAGNDHAVLCVDEDGTLYHAPLASSPAASW
jgi:hypothetical protein